MCWFKLSAILWVGNQWRQHPCVVGVRDAVRDTLKDNVVYTQTKLHSDRTALRTCVNFLRLVSSVGKTWRLAATQSGPPRPDRWPLRRHTSNSKRVCHHHRRAGLFLGDSSLLIAVWMIARGLWLTRYYLPRCVPPIMPQWNCSYFWAIDTAGLISGTVVETARQRNRCWHALKSL